MKKLLIIAAECPFPMRHGFAVRVGDMTRYLSRNFEQHLLVYGPDDVPPQEHFASVTVVRPPVVAGVGGALRAVRQRLRQAHFDHPMYASDELVAAVRQLQEQHDIDGCIVHTPLLARAFAGLRSRTLQVLDAHDLWHDKYRLFDRIGKGALLSHFRNQEREMATYRASDLTLAISLHDQQKLVAQGLPPEQVLHVPVSFAQTPLVSPVDEPTLLYTGGSGIFNCDALHHFIGETLPLIRQQVSGARLLIMGAEPEIRSAYGSDPHVELLPFLDDVSDGYRRAKVVVVPLRYGTGLKIKVLESFARRMPTVTSEAGMQGLHADDYPLTDLSADPQPFASAVVRALQDSEYRQELAATGHAVIGDHYTAEAVYSELVDKLEEQIEQRQATPCTQ
ncbi:MAG: glycosyltransferase family 4 protein [Planctomycetota bacterium]